MTDMISVALLLYTDFGRALPEYTAELIILVVGLLTFLNSCLIGFLYPVSALAFSIRGTPRGQEPGRWAMPDFAETDTHTSVNFSLATLSRC